MVIDLPLCPFAQKALPTTRYVVLPSPSRTEIIEKVLTEALDLIGTPEEITSTTVIIAPNAFVDDFASFYEAELFFDDHLQEGALGEEVLIACFHPQYQFGGLLDDDPVHFEKRSPFPVFNILRAERVWSYADQGLTQKIADNNAAVLSETGIEEVRRRFALDEIEERGGKKEGGE